MYWKNYFNWKISFNRIGAAAVAIALCGMQSAAQQQASPDTLQHILDRLDTLEKQNESLLTEVKQLREAVKAAQADSAARTQTLQDRAEVTAQEVKDQAQTKVESSQRFPISLTGMFLFDSYLFTGPADPEYAYLSGYTSGNPSAGATLAQSVIGLDFRGPSLPGGGKVHGFLSMDFYSQSSGYSVFRIRRGGLSFDWARRSLTVGQDKPLISPLEPTSFARVAVPPLSGAGNLWLWLPQVRYEEHIPFSTNTQVTLQAAALETNESYVAPYLPANVPMETARPALEARFEIAHHWSEESRFAVGVAAHASSSHLLGTSVPSRVISADLFFKPIQKLEISGTIFHGGNFANLGGESPGVTVERSGAVIPIRGSAGWMQVALPITSRLTFDIYAGRQVNDVKDLNSYDFVRTLNYAGNVLYRLSPNVIIGFEGSRNELAYLTGQQLSTNRYDATFAYLF